MRILFVIDSLKCGGAEKSLVSLLPLLNSDKYDISLWILHRGGIFESLVPSNVTIVHPPDYSLIDNVNKKLGQVYHSIVFRIYRLFGKRRHGAELYWKSCGWALKTPKINYDVAIAYQQGLPTYLVARKISARKKIAWINADIFEVGYNINFNLLFYQHFNFIVSVSEKLRKKIVKECPVLAEKLVCIYDVLNPFVINSLSEEIINCGTDSSFKSTIIVTVGRMVYLKGYDLAIEAGKILKNCGIHFKWLFIGDGPERHNIKALIEANQLTDYFQLLGMLPNPYPYMKAADIYVQTSRFEGFGLTIGEAKILGKPIVSTDFDVVYDQLTNFETGLIVEKSGESIASGIMTFLNDHQLRDKIISNLKKEENKTAFTEAVKVERMLDED